MRVSPLLSSAIPLASQQVRPSQSPVPAQPIPTSALQLPTGQSPACPTCTPAQHGSSGSAVLLQASLTATQSSLSANLEGFRARGFSRSLTVEATIQDGDQQLRLRTEVTHTVLRVAVGKADFGEDQSLGFLGDLLGKLPKDIRKSVEGFLKEDFLSSESAAADRLAGLALKGFGGSQRPGPAEEARPARGQFVDRMKELLANTFKEALTLVGDINDQARKSVARIQELTNQKLEGFRGVDSKV